MADAGVDRHLLFGLLALQNGLIDQAELVAAFHAWSRDKSRPIALHLLDRGALDAEQVAAVDAIVAIHLKEHGGVAERSLADVAAGPSTLEGLTLVGDPDLNQTLAAMTAVMPGLGRASITNRGHCAGAGLRYRVLRPHAKGGLGAVFVAIDDELNREVALKEIQDRFADDPVSRQRFLLEAEITGGLEHPGIVPVYGLGSYPDGRPYYAMRFIRGESLKDAVERFHADPDLERDPGRRTIAKRKLLRKFLDVCYAIEYAHQRGVLHRDLKPGNVMVGKFGETLVVDWGLAKSVGRPDPIAGDEHTLVPMSAGGSSSTLPGQTLGTPAFMSPEQAAGEIDRLGPASDVYSLGATLYCMMTGKPPFEGDDVNAVLQAVRAGTFPRPRALNPKIDRAAEAVCLKAMALKPEDRYGSARALAEDIERLAADEPVRAWHEPLTRTVWRWARRNRLTVAVAAVAVAALVVLDLFLVIKGRENQALEEHNQELAGAKARADERFNLAMNAIKTFHTGVSKELILKDEKFAKLKGGLLRSARDFYAHLQALSKGDSDHFSLQALGQAGFDLGSLMNRIGAKDDALTAHRDALAIRARLAAAPRAKPEARADEAGSRLAVARILGETGSTSEALREAVKARTVLTMLAKADTLLDGFHDDLASSLVTIGDLLSQTGKTEEALASYKEARTIQAALVKAMPADNALRSDLALTHFLIARMYWQTGRLDEASRSLKAARDDQEILAKDASDIEARGDLARSRFLYGYLMLQSNKVDEAMRLCKDALAAQETLVGDYPAVPEFQADLARSQYLMGRVLAQTGKTHEAMTAFKTAREIEEKRVADNHTVPLFQGELARTYHEIGNLLTKLDRTCEAMEWYRKSRTIREAVARTHPDLFLFQGDLARSDFEIGNLLMKMDRAKEAMTSFERARTRLERLVNDFPAVPRFQNDLARCYELIGALTSQTGTPAGSIAWFEKARGVRAGLAKANPKVGPWQGDHAKTLVRLGGALCGAGRDDEAESVLRAAVAILERLPERAPEFQVDLARSHALLSGLADRTGAGVSAAEGESHAVEAVVLLRRLADAGRLRLSDVRPDPGFNPLGNRPDFARLVNDLASRPPP